MEFLVYLKYAGILLLGIMYQCQGQWDAPLEYIIVEELPVGTTLGNVLEDGGLYSKHNDSVIQTLSCSFVKGQRPSGNEKLFSIHANGTIVVANRIDRDTLCPKKEQCYLFVDIQVQPVQYFAIFKVKISIEDINDNAPVFEQKTVFRTMAESTAIGSLIPVPAAFDPDSPHFGIRKYQLTSEHEDIFALEDSFITITEEEPEDILILVQGVLDRESVSSVLLRLLATDGGNPPKQGAMFVNISITDENDNNPVFRNTTYYVTIPEDTPVGASILQVEASDPDQGLAGIVTYTLSLKTEEKYGHTFAVDSKSGYLYLAGTLDAETHKSYALTILASDQDATGSPAQTTVFITVTDVNDNSPRIMLTLPDLQGDVPHYSLGENSPPDTFVFHFSASDLDQGQGGVVNCSIDSPYFTLKQMYTSEFKVLVKLPVDRESITEVPLLLICTDQGTEHHTSYQRVIINVLDENDNDPTFIETPYLHIIPHNATVGHHVTFVHANDLDLGENGTLEYHLRDPFQIFNINGTSGEITTKMLLNRNVLQFMNVTIVAEDHGNPRRTGSAIVMVQIRDAELTDSDVIRLEIWNEKKCEITENQEEGTEVCKVGAAIREPTMYNTLIGKRFNLTYALHRDNNAPFRVDPKTGVISSTRPIDREAQDLYKLTVLAQLVTDSQIVSSESRVVTIRVLDINDNAPVFLFPSNTNYTVLIPWDITVGARVADVRAIDPDLGPNSKLTYSIEAGDEDNLFTIDENIGRIYLNKPLDRNLTVWYAQLKLKVKDQGSKPLVKFNRLDLERTQPATLPVQQGGILTERNIIIFISVAAFCGALILIAVIVCTVCIRSRRKLESKSKQDAVKEIKKKDIMMTKLEELQQRGGQTIPDVLWVTCQGHEGSCSGDCVQVVNHIREGSSSMDAKCPSPRSDDDNSSQQHQVPAVVYLIKHHHGDKDSESNSSGDQYSNSTSDSGRGSSVAGTNRNDLNWVKQQQKRVSEEIGIASLWDDPILEDGSWEKPPILDTVEAPWCSNPQLRPPRQCYGQRRYPLDTEPVQQPRSHYNHRKYPSDEPVPSRGNYMYRRMFSDSETALYPPADHSAVGRSQSLTLGGAPVQPFQPKDVRCRLWERASITSQTGSDRSCGPRLTSDPRGEMPSLNSSYESAQTFINHGYDNDSGSCNGSLNGADRNNMHCHGNSNMQHCCHNNSTNHPHLPGHCSCCHVALHGKGCQGQHSPIQRSQDANTDSNPVDNDINRKRVLRESHV